MRQCHYTIKTLKRFDGVIINKASWKGGETTMTKLRKPNRQEIEELYNYVATLYWYEVDDPANEVRDEIENAAIVVFDNYVSDSPGYVGKIMTVIWRGGPQMYQVFIWRDGEIIPVTQDRQFQE